MVKKKTNKINKKLNNNNYKIYLNNNNKKIYYKQLINLKKIKINKIYNLKTQFKIYKII